jgi:hypothetical protein
MPRGKRKTSQSEDEKEKENDPSNISSEEAVWRKKLQAILDEFDIEGELIFVSATPIKFFLLSPFV